jgi:hypothetical protein
MARFAAAQNSEGAAIGTTVDVANFAGSSAYNGITASAPTLTAAQMLNGIAALSGQTAAQNVTTADAADLVAAIPNCMVGSSFDFVIQNGHSSSGAATVLAGAGVTLTGVTAVPVAKTQLYRGIVTNATAGAAAVRLVGLLTVPI